MRAVSLAHARWRLGSWRLCRGGRDACAWRHYGNAFRRDREMTSVVLRVESDARVRRDHGMTVEDDASQTRALADRATVHRHALVELGAILDDRATAHDRISHR